MASSLRQVSRLAMPKISNLNIMRSFSTSPRRLQTIAPVRRPVGAFRGTIFGFLLGSVAAGYGMYYYVVDDYKVSNNLLTEDIYALQNAVSRLDEHVRSLEDGIKGAGKS